MRRFCVVIVELLQLKEPVVLYSLEKKIEFPKLFLLLRFVTVYVLKWVFINNAIRVQYLLLFCQMRGQFWKYPVMACNILAKTYMYLYIHTYIHTYMHSVTGKRRTRRFWPKFPRTIQQTKMFFPYFSTYPAVPNWTYPGINGTESVHNIFVVFCTTVEGLKYIECAFWCYRIDFSSLMRRICLGKNVCSSR